MDDILFEILKVAIMVLVMVVARYLIPWLKEKIGTENVESIAKWADKAVKMAQQVHKDWDGPDKKALVTNFIKRMLTEKNISLSDEQIDILIEAAVKQMKMEDNSGFLIETDIAEEIITEQEG